MSFRLSKRAANRSSPSLMGIGLPAHASDAGSTPSTPSGQVPTAKPPRIAVRRPGAAGQVPHPHAVASAPDQPPQNFTVHRYPPSSDVPTACVSSIRSDPPRSPPAWGRWCAFSRVRTPRQLDVEDLDVAHALDELRGPGAGQGLGQLPATRLPSTLHEWCRYPHHVHGVEQAALANQAARGVGHRELVVDGAGVPEPGPLPLAGPRSRPSAFPAGASVWPHARRGWTTPPRPVCTGLRPSQVRRRVAVGVRGRRAVGIGRPSPASRCQPPRCRSVSARDARISLAAPRAPRSSRCRDA